jgi:predicted Rossmann fold nucleotide-binding protein DprA/Smf involved in DNA uptake
MTNPSTRDVAEVMRDEMVMRQRIAAMLRDGPKTIPELAEALGCPSQEVVFWVMAMWRYGMLVPTGKAGADGYYRYRLSEEHPVPTA